MRLLEHCVRDDLNKNAKRVMAVLDPVKLTIENYPEGKTELMEAQDLPESESVHLSPFSRRLYIERGDLWKTPQQKVFPPLCGRRSPFKKRIYLKCESVVKDSHGEIEEIICSYDPTSKSGRPEAKGR